MLGTFANTLKFSVHEIDTATGTPDESSYDDEYQVGAQIDLPPSLSFFFSLGFPKLEDIEVQLADYMKRTACANFKEEWDALGDTAEYVDKFNLPAVQSLKGRTLSHTANA